MMSSPARKRADALAITARARPSARSVWLARQRVAALAWSARLDGDWSTYREIMGRLAVLRGLSKANGWRSPGLPKLGRSPPAQLVREAQTRVQAERGQQRTRTEQQERDLQRWRANALAHALWALHQGERDWTKLSTSSEHSTRPPTQQLMQRPLGPAYLEIGVPGSPFGPAGKLRLFRHDYENLLELWGYHRVTRATRLAAKLRGSGLSSTDLDQLHLMALDAATHPNLARAWHGYVTSSRLGDVFTLHSSGTMQLAPRRNGDLREAVLELYAQCQLIEFCTPGV